MKKRLVIGILAHVDAGKTTLSEGLLYLSGSIRTLGRVDHKDAFLDTYAMERARGITIFSKQAGLVMGDVEVTLLDTPGHVDFSTEMERTLQVLDYAILVINGADGVQGHTRTLWKLLKQYGIPVFLFINKMDQIGTEREKLLSELQTLLDERCIDFSEELSEECLDALAMCDEELMEEFLETGQIDKQSITKAVQTRTVFPCFFGSALKLEGVEELIQGISFYSQCPDYGTEFGARVYKISRDSQGNRLTHLKITGGSLKVKTLLAHAETEEKVDQIRIYSGSGFQTVQEAEAGVICAVTGLEHSYCGEGLGQEADSDLPILEPVLSYQLLLPEDCDVHKAWKELQQLEEENPLLRMEWQESAGEIHIQVMGEVELEILKNIIQERFGLEVFFGEGSLVYKETILEPVEGVGHFEPLRHYAEVHVWMEPGEPGSGLQIEAQCSEDILNGNWQRLVLTHLAERKHPGVLTGSEITDMKLTLVAGRAHQKHTEGGDFRQATYRAVRQGLRKAKCVLLEPVYEFRLEVPTENSGRALADIQKMYGSFQVPEMEGDMAVITGTAPVSAMRGYQSEVNAYTKGCGKLFCSLKGYMPCHNQEEIIEKFQYDPESDVENPTGSVFCSHGSGFIVPWYQVEEYMHVDSGLRMREPEPEQIPPQTVAVGTAFGTGTREEEKELEEIFKRTYGSSKRTASGKRDYDIYDDGMYAEQREKQPSDPKYQKRSTIPERKEQFLLVDGYNIIFAWEELNELSKVSLEAARGKLMDILCNYQGYKKMNLILVFDAYKVPGNIGEMMDYHNIHVVYTKEAETADQYIEKFVHKIGKQYDVTVATSDGLEQLIIWGEGAIRLSARGLREEVELAEREMRERFLDGQKTEKNYAFRQFLTKEE